MNFGGSISLTRDRLGSGNRTSGAIGLYSEMKQDSHIQPGQAQGSWPGRIRPKVSLRGFWQRCGNGPFAETPGQSAERCQHETWMEGRGREQPVFCLRVNKRHPGQVYCLLLLTFPFPLSASPSLWCLRCSFWCPTTPPSTRVLGLNPSSFTALSVGSPFVV
jgi:hypothetical protein